MKAQEHTIWANYLDSILPIAQDLGAEDGIDLDDLSVGEWHDYIMTAYEINEDYRQDEMANLRHAPATDGEIIAIADLGRWDGRVTGYKEMHTYEIADVLNEWSGCDNIRFYVDDRKNLRSRGDHHDGSNRVLFRAFKGNLSDEQKDNFLDKLETGRATSKDITRYTKRLGDLVSDIYGW